MTKRLNFLLRCLAFMAGMATTACGIATITNAELGTTPITSIPYAVNALFPLSIGAYTGGINAFLVVLEFFILGRKRFTWTHAMQLPPVLFFGLCIDFWMHVTAFLPHLSYAVRFAFLCAGVVLMAAGIVVQVAAHVIVLPGEGFVMAVALRARKSFGSMKVVCDVSMVMVSMTISFLGLGHIVGVREGTIVSAVCTGFVVRFISYLVRRVRGDAPESTEERTVVEVRRDASGRVVAETRVGDAACAAEKEDAETDDAGSVDTETGDAGRSGTESGTQTGKK